MIKEEIQNSEDIDFRVAVAKELGEMMANEELHVRAKLPDDPEAGLAGVGKIHELDLSLASLATIELALAHTYREYKPSFLKKLLKAQAPPEEVDDCCVTYGCYIGQVLATQAGWAWHKDPELGFVLKHGVQVHQPDHQVFARLTSKSPQRIDQFYEKFLKA